MVFVLVLFSIVENEAANRTRNNNNTTIYQRGYVDNGLDTAPVRREAERGREASIPTNTEDRGPDQILQNEMIISAPNRGSSRSVEKRKKLQNTKVAANMLVDLQEKMHLQDIESDRKKITFYNNISHSVNTYLRESIRIEYIKLKQ